MVHVVLVGLMPAAADPADAVVCLAGLVHASWLDVAGLTVVEVIVFVALPVLQPVLFLLILPPLLL